MTGKPKAVLDFGGLELRNGDSVTFDVPGQDGEVMPPDEGGRFFPSALRNMTWSEDGYTGYVRLPPTIEGEATRIAGELPAPEDRDP